MLCDVVLGAEERLATSLIIASLRAESRKYRVLRLAKGLA